MSHILISYFNLSLFFSLEALLRIAPVVIWMKNIPCLAGNNVINFIPLCFFVVVVLAVVIFFHIRGLCLKKLKILTLYTTVDTDPIVFLVNYQFTGVFSVFRLVGGLETLSALERVETDEKDRPKVSVKKR